MTLNKEIKTSQQLELEDWSAKVKSGEADKITRDILFNNVGTTIDPRMILREVATDIMPNVHIKRNIPTDKELEKIGQLLTDFGIETDFSMLETVEVKYRGLIMNLRRELIKEYDCKTYSEKALVDIVIGAYARNLTYSKKLLCLKDPEYLSSERNGMLGILSKEIDRANRHFLTALETLRQLKQPSLNINVKTKNAFIGQNQEFNNIKNPTMNNGV